METVLAEIRHGKFRPVYLFFGNEPYLIHELVEAIKMNLIGTDTDGLDFNLLDAEHTSLSSLLTYVYTPPWSQEKRLIIIKNVPWFRAGGRVKESETKEPCQEGSTKQAAPVPGTTKKEASETDAFLQYLKAPNLDTVLVLIAAGEVDRRRKFFRTLVSAGAALECAELRGGRRREWIKQKARQMDLSLESEALEYLIHFTGKSLYSLAHELEKISLFIGKGEKRVSLALVQALCTRQMEDRIFDIMDAVTEKKALLALDRIRELSQSGVPAQRIFYLLVRHYRILLRARMLINQGYTAYTQPELALKLEVKLPWLVKKYLKQARGHTQDELSRGLKQMLEMDVALKRSEGNPDMWLEVLIAGLI